MSDTRFVIVTPRQIGKPCRYLTPSGKWSPNPALAHTVETQTEAVRLCKSHDGEYMQVAVDEYGIAQPI